MQSEARQGAEARSGVGSRHCDRRRVGVVRLSRLDPRRVARLALHLTSTSAAPFRPRTARPARPRRAPPSPRSARTRPTTAPRAASSQIPFRSEGIRRALFGASRRSAKAMPATASDGRRSAPATSVQRFHLPASARIGDEHRQLAAIDEEAILDWRERPRARMRWIHAGHRRRRAGGGRSGPSIASRYSVMCSPAKGRRP